LALSREREEAGTAEAMQIFESAREEIADLKRRAAADVSAKLDQARANVQAESEKLSVAIMEKVLERRLAI
jgi:F0F1-type ATP synthase membrane subunit b/b'